MRVFPMIAALCLASSAQAIAAPTTIQLGTGATVTTLKPDQDATLICPPVRKEGATIIIGGRNITLQGCSITIPEKRPAGDMYRRAIYVKGATGTVHIEGVHVTNPYNQQFDAFYFAAPQADVVLLNNRVEGLTGRNKEFHSDAVQTSGTRTLRINGMTIVGGYQMLTLFSKLGTGEIWIERVNGRFKGRQIWAKDDAKRGDNGGTFIWLAEGASSCRPAATRIHLKDVYAKIYPQRSAGGVGWPNNRKAGCPAVVAPDGHTVTWPALGVEGRVTLGNAPGGDFVPADRVGLNFRP